MCLISRFFNLHPQTPSSTVRMSFKIVARPIRCAESDSVVLWPYWPLLWRYSEKHVPSPPTMPTKLRENVNISMSPSANQNPFRQNSSQQSLLTFIPYKLHEQTASS